MPRVWMLCALLALAPAAAAQQGAPTGPQAAAVDRAAGGPEAIGRRIFEALNRHREANKVPAVPFSPRIYIALQDHIDFMVKRGYKGGPPRNKKYPKLGERTRDRHGWNLSLYDNYSNGKKDGMNPDEIIRILQTNPDIKSMLRADLNVGAAAATPVPDSADDYVIVVALTRAPRRDIADLPKIAAADQEWAAADAPKRKSMVKGLAAMHSGDTLLLLTRAVEDSDPDVRSEAVKAVAKLGDPWPIPALLARFEAETDPKAKTEVQKALEAISGEKGYKDELAKWQAWWSVERDIFQKQR